MRGLPGFVLGRAMDENTTDDEIAYWEAVAEAYEAEQAFLAMSEDARLFEDLA